MLPRAVVLLVDRGGPGCFVRGGGATARGPLEDSVVRRAQPRLRLAEDEPPRAVCSGEAGSQRA